MICGTSKGKKLRVEKLEDRSMLNGNVVVSAVGATLLIRGDGGNNGIQISGTATPGQYVVAPIAGSGTTINGNGSAAGKTVNKITALISADMGAGNDTLLIGGSTTITLPTSVVVIGALAMIRLACRISSPRTL